jgi:hypothetical protein
MLAVLARGHMKRKELLMQTVQRKPGWSAQETRGQQISAYGREIIPIGRLWKIRWPGGGLLWHRPAAIEVRQGEQVARLPIADMSRRVSVILVAISTLTALGAVWRLQRRLRERNQKR